MSIGKTTKRVLLGLIFVYILSVMIACICFNIGFIREHGFLAWSASPGRIIVVGCKSLAWPFFLCDPSEPSVDFSDWTADDRANSKHFMLSIQADLASIDLSNQRFVRELSKAEQAMILGLKRTALEEAKLVEDAVLLKAHPELPDRFRELYQRGLELRILHMESPNGNPEAERTGLRLHDQWADWFNENRDVINFPK